MRRVLGCDLHIAARYLLAQRPEERPAKAQRLLDRALVADRYRKRYGHAHPVCGNGTVTGAVGYVALPPERHVDDPEYLDCLQTVLNALSDLGSKHMRAPKPRPNGRPQHTYMAD